MTAEEAKYLLKEYMPVIGFVKYREALNVAIEALERQEVAKDGGWIPCSEQMPKFDQEVLITADDYAVYQCVMRNGGFHVWEAGWIDKKRVLAWMELPAPYQKGE